MTALHCRPCDGVGSRRLRGILSTVTCRCHGRRAPMEEMKTTLTLPRGWSSSHCLRRLIDRSREILKCFSSMVI